MADESQVVLDETRADALLTAAYAAIAAAYCSRKCITLSPPGEIVTLPKMFLDRPHFVWRRNGGSFVVVVRQTPDGASCRAGQYGNQTWTWMLGGLVPEGVTDALYAFLAGPTQPAVPYVAPATKKAKAKKPKKSRLAGRSPTQVIVDDLTDRPRPPRPLQRVRRLDLS